jgi:hypothetical protein
VVVVVLDALKSMVLLITTAISLIVVNCMSVVGYS